MFEDVSSRVSEIQQENHLRPDVSLTLFKSSKSFHCQTQEGLAKGLYRLRRAPSYCRPCTNLRGVSRRENVGAMRMGTAFCGHCRHVEIRIMVDPHGYHHPIIPNRKFIVGYTLCPYMG